MLKNALIVLLGLSTVGTTATAIYYGNQTLITDKPKWVNKLKYKQPNFISGYKSNGNEYIPTDGFREWISQYEDRKVVSEINSVYIYYQSYEKDNGLCYIPQINGGYFDKDSDLILTYWVWMKDKLGSQIIIC